MGIFDDCARIWDEFHGQTKGKLQVSHINALLGGNSVLDLVDLLLTDVDLENFDIIRVEETITWALN